MTMVVWVVGAIAAQLAVALFLSKCIRAGKGPRVVEAGIGSSPPASAAGESVPAPAAVDSNVDLSALLTAVAPQAEEEVPSESSEPSATSPPRAPVAGPESRK
jgi:hypothetical protein